MEGQGSEISSSQNSRPEISGSLPPAAASKPIEKWASIFPGKNAPIDTRLSTLMERLESVLGMPIWLMVQDGNPSNAYSEINPQVFVGFRNSCGEIQEGKPVGLLIESPGGSAHLAYQIVRFFQRRASHFTVIVPRCAKSAATLMALGATELIMGRDAELGPLDVQIYDPEREEYGSALNAVQSLERLNAFSMMAIDQMMLLLIRRTGRRIDILLPKVLEYVVSFVKPLLEKIDAIDYTKKSRELKVAEQYAIRLMKSNYPWVKVNSVARSLVEKFPTHSFIIDRDEASSYQKIGENEEFGLGLKVKKNPPEVEGILDEMVPILDGLTVIGRLREVSS